MTPMLDLQDVSKTFRVKRGLFGPTATLKAVDRLSLAVMPGRTLGIVGESGCGKSTAVAMMLGLSRPDQGQVLLDGRDIASIPAKERACLIQPVFQNPYGALNPVRRVRDLIGQPLRLQGGADEADAVRQMLDRVALPDRLGDAYPSELSGGQRQRVAIARALILGPTVLICDEPTSALDVSVQAQILNLLLSLRRDLKLTMVFVSHDLAVVEHLADDVAVLYLGQLVERAAVDDLFGHARHPYSRALLAATLAPDPTLGLPEPQLGSAAADPFAIPDGCLFAPRCKKVQDLCLEDRPQLRKVRASLARCHFAEDT